MNPTIHPSPLDLGTMQGMASIPKLFLILLLVLPSVYSACPRCLHQGKASFQASSGTGGACGYGTYAIQLNGGYIAAGNSALYRSGIGCGGCFQVRCKVAALCSSNYVTVVLTDDIGGNPVDMVLSSKAFNALAKSSSAVNDLTKLGTVDVEYKRVPCQYSKNIAVLVEANSNNGYLAVAFLNQGGQTDITSVDVATAGTASPKWISMSRGYSAVWSTSNVPAAPLQFRLGVIAGSSGKSYTTGVVLPKGWSAGAVYDTGIQISDLALENCSPCAT